MKIDRKVKTKVARYYYIENYTQTKIADMLSIPRQTINRIVQNLVKDGIVHIEILGEENSYTKIESDLEKKYGLKQAIIIESDNPAETESHLGQKGAEYVAEVLRPNTSLGLSWGNTLGYLAEWFPRRSFENISVVQLVGGSNYLQNSMKADEITRIIAEKVNGKAYLLYAPSHVENKEAKEVILGEKNIRNAFTAINRCDIAVIGIGSMKLDATLFQEKYLSQKEYHQLIGEGCVGDICSRYFNTEGEIVTHRINDIVVGIDIQHLKKIPLVVGIAGGMDKRAAIAGALKGNYLDVLITTKDVAETLTETGDSSIE